MWLEFARPISSDVKSSVAGLLRLSAMASMTDETHLHHPEAFAEAAYDKMYDAGSPSGATAFYSDAKEALADAIGANQVVKSFGAEAREEARNLLEEHRKLIGQARGEAEQILSRLRTAYLGWLRGLAIGMLVLGLVTYLGLRLAGLDFAAFFAVFTAIAFVISIAMRRLPLLES